MFDHLPESSTSGSMASSPHAFVGSNTDFPKYLSFSGEK